MEVNIQKYKCPYCGDESIFSDMCDRCYQVTSFIDRFIKTEKGKKLIIEKLKEQGVQVNE